jgi:hypothetical protein
MAPPFSSRSLIAVALRSSATEGTGTGGRNAHNPRPSRRHYPALPSCERRRNTLAHKEVHRLATGTAAERRQESPEGGVTLADLVDGRGHIALTDSISVAAAQLAEVCRGRTFTPFDLQYWRRVRSVQDTIDATVAEMQQRSGLTEHRLAKNLGITADRLADVSFQLWQSTFSDERDQRAGPDANQQKRGRISRELRAELEKALADGND